MSLVRHCDKCGKVLMGQEEKMASDVSLDMKHYDLCKECSNTLYTWLNSKKLIDMLIEAKKSKEDKKVEKKEVKDTELTKEMLDKILKKYYPYEKSSYNKSRASHLRNGLIRSGFKTVGEVVNYEPAKKDRRLYKISTERFIEVRDILRKEYPSLCDSGTIK